jgi:uncharacterized protein
MPPLVGGVFYSGSAGWTQTYLEVKKVPTSYHAASQGIWYHSLMKPRITVITLGVDNLERSLTFYRDGLGFTTQGIIGEQFEYGAVVFIELQSGLKLALWPRESMAHDSGVALQLPSATEFTIGHNVKSKEEVDEVMVHAKKAGAKIVKPAVDTAWGGYSGYFQDPDGHLWEIVWNPDMELVD